MKAKLSDSEQVTEHIQKLEPTIGNTIEYIRQVVLNTNSEIAERIKWNNPSFYFNGCCNLYYCNNIFKRY